MIEFYKRRGETPLEALNRLRKERPELEKEILSYAGRLDPMAEGLLPILVGEEENKKRKEFLNRDKEYHVSFLIGCNTDTGDMLGIVEKEDFRIINQDLIVESIQNLVEIKEQRYPWYSSKTVAGIPLFEYARKGMKDIERPIKDIKIYSISNIQIEERKLNDVVLDSIEDIKKVTGDFRQEEIINKWNNLLNKNKDVLIVSFNIQVSSGTYIRGLTEEVEKHIGVPVVLYKLVRTQIL